MDAGDVTTSPPPGLGAGTLRRYALSQRWDPRHLATVRRLLAPRVGERVLEVGCGPGHLTRRLGELGLDCVGIDANPQVSGMAAGVRVMKVEALEFADGWFDKVVCIHALEHFPDLERAMAEMARVLRPGGTMLLVYPAEPFRGLFAVPDALILYRNPLRARELHRHLLRPARVRVLAEAAGLEHVHSDPQLAPVRHRPATAGLTRAGTQAHGRPRRPGKGRSGRCRRSGSS
jgi:SAM-dependent methyltransferase